MYSRVINRVGEPKHVWRLPMLSLWRLAHQHTVLVGLPQIAADLSMFSTANYRNRPGYKPTGGSKINPYRTVHGGQAVRAAQGKSHFCHPSIL